MNPKIGDLITLKPEHRDPTEEQGVMLVLGQEKEWDQTLGIDIPYYKVLTHNGTISWLKLATFHAYQVIA
jgi:hypothetical protein